MAERRPNSRICKGTNKAGGPCGTAPLKGQDYCMAHDRNRTDDERFGSASWSARAGASEKPRVPKLMEVLQQRVEEEADEIVAALFEALDATRLISVRVGDEGYESTEVADHALRTAAARELFDRAVGKPRQTTELTGPGGGSLVLEAPADGADRSTRAARLLAEAGLVELAANGNGNGNGHH